MGNTPTKQLISYTNSIKICDSQTFELFLLENPVTKDYIIEHFYQLSKRFGVVCLESRISESLDYILTQDQIDFSLFQQTDSFFPVFWQPVNEDLQLSDFKPVKIIGKGGFSTVVLARKLDTGDFFAIKCLEANQNSVEDGRAVYAEVNIMKELRHPFIIEFKNFIECEEKVFIVMEFCPGGELASYFTREKFSEEWAKFFFCEILAALEYLHCRNIVYRDLKPENVMLDCEGHIKLIDFGLSKQLSSKHEYTFSFCGSSKYLSPEMQSGEAHNLTLDYYSLGMFLYEMLSGHIPHQTEVPLSPFSPKLTFPSHLSKPCKSMLEGLLQKYPENRLGFSTIQEIKTHKWLKSVNWKKVLKKKYKSPINPVSRQSNFQSFPQEEISKVFKLKTYANTTETELINAKDSFNSTVESKKNKESELNYREDSGIFTSSIENSLMINQIPTFLTKFLF